MKLIVNCPGLKVWRVGENGQITLRYQDVETIGGAVYYARGLWSPLSFSLSLWWVSLDIIFALDKRKEG